MRLFNYGLFQSKQSVLKSGIEKPAKKYSFRIDLIRDFFLISSSPQLCVKDEIF